MSLPHWLIALLVTTVLAAVPPRRVVSQTVGTDELLLAIADPAQIVALCHLGHDPRYAPSADVAARFPAMKKSTVEEILRLKPDLVLTTLYAPPESLALLKKAGIRLHVVTRFESLEDVYENLRSLGSILGRESQAAALIASCQMRVRALESRLQGVRPTRVLAAGVYPFAAGSATSFQDICDHAGAVNVAAEAGLKGIVPMPSEKVLTWKVDVLVGPSEPGQDLAALLRDMAPYRFMPALKAGRLVVIPGQLFSATSHRRIEAYEWLARALHPECFR